MIWIAVTALVLLGAVAGAAWLIVKFADSFHLFPGDDE